MSVAKTSQLLLKELRAGSAGWSRSSVPGEGQGWQEPTQRRHPWLWAPNDLGAMWL